MMTQNVPVPIDLPEPEHLVYDNNDAELEIGVTAEDKYVLEDDNKLYELEALIPIIDQEMSLKDPANRKLKISGDKMAHYEAVFQLIALAKERGYAPILVFDAEGEE